MMVGPLPPPPTPPRPLPSPAQFRSRLTKGGELIITSQQHRTQHRNLEEAISKLEGLLREASEVPRGPSQLTVARIKTL